jgi:bifunctional non-homologous end joining protein LigD
MAGTPSTPARQETIEVGGRQLRLSNLDKVLYPASGFTKAEVIDYYLRIAPVLLPHVRDRPLTMRRYPDGVEGQGFYEKHAPRGMPEWIRTVDIPRSARSADATTIEFPLLCDTSTLVWTANLAALELHVPQWRVDDRGVPQSPDLLVFDLDPGPPADLVQCCEAALLIREELEQELGWRAHPKTSGAKGLQVYVALASGDRQDSWDGDGAREQARRIAEALAARRPDLIVANMRKPLRTGRVLIDWSQNNVTKTTVAPYSLRARTEPTVSTPLRWDEVASCLDTGQADVLRFRTEDVLARVAAEGDLFAPLLG